MPVCEADNFSKQHQPREEAVKIFALFCPKLFPRKINKQAQRNESGFQEGIINIRSLIYTKTFPQSVKSLNLRKKYQFSHTRFAKRLKKTNEQTNSR